VPAPRPVNDECADGNACAETQQRTSNIISGVTTAHEYLLWLILGHVNYLRIRRLYHDNLRAVLLLYGNVLIFVAIQRP
jgi:hypothetical protein